MVWTVTYFTSLGKLEPNPLIYFSLRDFFKGNKRSSATARYEGESEDERISSYIGVSKIVNERLILREVPEFLEFLESDIF